jgi:hypothetical protein
LFKKLNKSISAIEETLPNNQLNKEEVLRRGRFLSSSFLKQESKRKGGEKE